MVHPQSATTLQIEKPTSERIVSIIIVQICSKAMDMLRDQDNQKHFQVYWEPSSKIKGTVTQNTTRKRITAPYVIFTYIERQIKSKSGESRDGVLIQKVPGTPVRPRCSPKH